MKMKTYIAPTMSEAMDQLRHELGENAILVSTQRLGAGAGVRLTAAIEEEEEDFGFEISDEPKQSAFHEKVRRILKSHNTPDTVIEKVLIHLKEPVQKRNWCLSPPLWTRHSRFIRCPNTSKGKLLC